MPFLSDDKHVTSIAIYANHVAHRDEASKQAMGWLITVAVQTWQ